MRTLNKYLIFLFLILYSVLLALQGMHFGDAGWHLTAYDQFLSHPASVNYYFMYWLSGLVGHFWQNLLPQGGLFWSRVGAIVFLSATFILYARLLLSYSLKRNPFLLLLPTYLFIYGGGPEALNYDILTQFFYAISLSFLLRGMIQNKTSMLFIAGLFLGLNLFIKISNLTGLLFLGIIPFYAIIQGTKTRETLKQSLSVLSGLFLSVIVTLVVMKGLGHLDLYFKNLVFLSQLSGSREASHSFKSMLSAYGSGYLKMGIVSLPAFLIFIYFQRIRKMPTISRKYFWTVLVITGLGIAFFAFYLGNPFWSKVRYFFLGSMFITGIYLTCKKGNKPTVRLLAFSGLILLFIAPLGSDSGLEKMNLGSWILGPLFLDMADRKEALYFLKQKFYPGGENLFRALMLILLITFLSYAWNNPYNDPGSRFKKTFTADTPGLKFIHTSRERANCVTGLMAGIQNYVLPGDTLLAYIEIPMVQYLSGTTPYLNTSWPKLLFSSDLFKTGLHAPLKSTGLPIVIKQTIRIAHSNWPLNTIPGVKGDFDPENRYREYGLILNNFLKEFHYSLIWHNRAFELWMPSDNRNSGFLKPFSLGEKK